jgi:hypothetical protein
MHAAACICAAAEKCAAPIERSAYYTTLIPVMLHYSLRRAQRDMHTLYPLCAICACLLAKRHILQIFAFQLSSVNGLICFYPPVAYFFLGGKIFSTRAGIQSIS